MNNEGRQLAEQTTPKTWWDRNKKKVMIGGGLACTVFGAYLFVQLHDKLFLGLNNETLSNTELPINTGINTDVADGIIVAVADTPAKIYNIKEYTRPFEVRGFVRNLPKGYHASQEKITEACSNNIILLDGQTWVNSYMKGVREA